MSIFDKFMKKNVADNEMNLDAVHIAKEDFFSGEDGNVIGAFALNEDSMTALPLDPKKKFLCRGKTVGVWKLLFLGLSKKGAVGELNYYSAIKKLKKFAVGKKEGYLIIKPMTLDEQMKIVS